MNSWRASSHFCPVAVRNWMPANHSCAAFHLGDESVQVTDGRLGDLPQAGVGESSVAGQDVGQQLGVRLVRGPDRSWCSPPVIEAVLDSSRRDDPGRPARRTRLSALRDG